MTPQPDRATANVSPAEIQQWIAARLALMLGIEPDEIDAGQPLARYGLDSVQAVLLVSDLEQWLGLKFTENPLHEHDSVQLLAQHLADCVRGQKRR